MRHPQEAWGVGQPQPWPYSRAHVGQSRPHAAPTPSPCPSGAEHAAASAGSGGREAGGEGGGPGRSRTLAVGSCFILFYTFLEMNSCRGRSSRPAGKPQPPPRLSRMLCAQRLPTAPPRSCSVPRGACTAAPVLPNPTCPWIRAQLIQLHQPTNNMNISLWQSNPGPGGWAGCAQPPLHSRQRRAARGLRTRAPRLSRSIPASPVH